MHQFVVIFLVFLTTTCTAVLHRNNNSSGDSQNHGIVDNQAPLFTLTHDFSGTSFFNNFNFFSSSDPTHGYVYYTTAQQAWDWGLIKAYNDHVTIAPDSWSISSGSGRASVRIESKSTWNTGLFIADITHLPVGCGVWPAYWLVGPNWPSNGEVDIVEYVHNATIDQTTLHTNDGCNMESVNPDTFTGKWATGKFGNNADNCYIKANDQYDNQGCGILAGWGTVGQPFNNAGGGVYATWISPNFIKSWFFPRNQIPGDIRSRNPNPNAWGKPYANFEFGAHCPNTYFRNLQIIINLTFCGDWAGSVFQNDCPGLGSCNAYVQNNPPAFREAHFSINSVLVYQ